MPEDLRMTPAEAVGLAQRLIDDGRPFHAHEVLEATWKSAPAGERALWKGLAQIAVGLTHARRGNSRGAVTLLRRGAAAVAGYEGRPGLAGLDLAAVTDGAAVLAGRIADHGLEAVPQADIRVSLTG
jgi:predicted metal-dependent hydrolase